MRAVECMLGIPVPGYNPFIPSPNSNFTSAMVQAASEITISEVQQAVFQAIPILLQIAIELKIDAILNPAAFWAGSATRAKSALLISKCASFNLQCFELDVYRNSFMDINWQYNNPANPADAAIGPQIYDNHLYYSWVLVYSVIHA